MRRINILFGIFITLLYAAAAAPSAANASTLLRYEFDTAEFLMNYQQEDGPFLFQAIGIGSVEVTEETASVTFRTDDSVMDGRGKFYRYGEDGRADFSEVLNTATVEFQMEWDLLEARPSDDFFLFGEGRGFVSVVDEVGRIDGQTIDLSGMAPNSTLVTAGILQPLIEGIEFHSWFLFTGLQYPGDLHFYGGRRSRSEIPEPATAVLLLAGAIGAAGIRRRRAR